MKNGIPYDTYFPILNEVGECEYLLHYIEDKVVTKLFPEGGRTEVISEYSLRNCENVLDYFLVQNFDIYIFSEIEEYTYVIIRLLSKKYPHKIFCVFDVRMRYFPELEDTVIFMNPVDVEFNNEWEIFYRKQCLWITSDGVNFEGFPYEYFANIYNSINVLYSMLWCSKRESFGEKNKDYTIYLADYNGGTAGLVDYMKYTYAHYLIAKQHRWKFCIDLSHKPNQYLISENENMWDYFFESLSDLSVKEVYESFSVVRASINCRNMLVLSLLPYFRSYRIIANSKEFMKNIRFNRETKIKIADLMPEILKKDNRVLGVILRGTDYRPEAMKYERKNKKVADLKKMISKCRFIMELYGYQYIFLATEDLEYFEKMQEEFGDKCLFIEQKRGWHDYHLGYRVCSELLSIEDGKEFGRRYLAIIQSLANCRSLISNVYNGTTWAAEGLNNSQYEYYEVVTP